MTFPSYPTITRQLPPRQLASFPRTGLQGRLTAAWLWWLRRHLNRDRYTLTLRGRKAKTPRRFGQQSIPLAAARRVGLYIDDKMGSKLDNYHRAWGAHDAKRTAEKRETALHMAADTLKAQTDRERALLEDGLSNQRVLGAGLLAGLRKQLEAAQADVAALAASRDDAEADFQTMVRQYAKLRDTLHGERCESCGDRIRGLVEKAAKAITDAAKGKDNGLDLHPRHDPKKWGFEVKGGAS